MGALETVGDLVDRRYRLIQTIGRGGVGVVHRAFDVMLGREVALKIGILGDDQDERAALRARREAHALAQLRHENVVRVYAHGVEGAKHWIAMELVDGRDLATIVEEQVSRGSTLPFHRAVDIVSQVARGLAAVHEHGILHLDIKPSNIVIEDRTNRAVLVDFGLARRSDVTEDGVVGGTPTYMAPEQAMMAEHASVDARCDVYALGCLAFELFAGVVPYDARTPVQLLIAHRQSPVPRVSSIKPELAPLDDVIARAMAKSAGDRHETATAFLEELEVAAQRCAPPSGRRRVTLSYLPPEPPASDLVRVVILATKDPGAEIAATVSAALSATGDAADIASVETPAALLDELDRAPADLAIIDADAAKASSIVLAERVRRSAIAMGTEIIVLGEVDSGVALAYGIRELPKPVPPQVLRVIVSRAAARLAERRAAASRSACAHASGF